MSRAGFTLVRAVTALARHVVLTCCSGAAGNAAGNLEQPGLPSPSSTCQQKPSQKQGMGKVEIAWSALTSFHVPLKTGNWKRGNSLVCSHLFPCATKPRELEMQEQPSKANNCAIFGVFSKNFGEAEQSPAFTTQGRPCGGHTVG